MNGYASTPEEKERSLGLFLRGSLLARILAVAHIYQQIVEIPGIVFDIGTWRGQTAVLCENFRAIYEPLHFNRRIVCFDTFEGMPGLATRTARLRCTRRALTRWWYRLCRPSGSPAAGP